MKWKGNHPKAVLFGEEDERVSKQLVNEGGKNDAKSQEIARLGNIGDN